LRPLRVCWPSTRRACRPHSHGSWRSQRHDAGPHRGQPDPAGAAAFNARAALHSCELATLGFAPASAVFEGAYGYLSLFEGAFDLAPILDSLGHTWRIAEFSHKPFPAGRATHGGSKA
jgi:2-methylcitrate dehydratase PrpD